MEGETKNSAIQREPFRAYKLCRDLSVPSYPLKYLIAGKSAKPPSLSSSKKTAAHKEDSSPNEDLKINISDGELRIKIPDQLNKSSLVSQIVNLVKGIAPFHRCTYHVFAISHVVSSSFNVVRGR